MNDEEEQLMDMCIIIIKLLNRLASNGQISEEEYNKQVRIKKQFLDYLNEKK